MLGAFCCGPKVRGALGFSKRQIFRILGEHRKFRTGLRGAGAVPVLISHVNCSLRRKPERLLAAVGAIKCAPASRSMAPLAKQAHGRRVSVSGARHAAGASSAPAIPWASAMTRTLRNARRCG